MLYPVRNKYRQIIDLSGIWKIKIDYNETGEKEKFYEGFESDLEIAIPGSWNEQLDEIGLLNYIGTVWFYKKVFIPEDFYNKTIWLRIGSADYNSKIWINGYYIGQNQIGFLPFVFDISHYIVLGEFANIVISVNNKLNENSIPQGITSENYLKENRLREETYPPTRFDFFPFGGIHRPVLIYTTPKRYIRNIRFETKITGTNTASAKIKITTQNFTYGLAKVILSQKNFIKSFQEKLINNSAEIEVDVDNCKFWSPSNPYLYNLQIQILEGKNIIDEYEMPVGIREVKIVNNKLLLNGEEIFLRGFGKHEDFWIIGRGLFLPLMIKDFQLLKWINANSFRTSHYPYSEEILQYADRHGIMVIDEVPAVSIDTRYVTDKTIQNHKEYITRLIERDYNHPSVIMWSLGNEPNLVGADSYFDGSGRKYWEQIFEHARKLDETRPFTVPNCKHAGIDDPVFELSDVLSINRYYGWYENPGQILKAIELMNNEMELLYKKYNKPIFVTEFGADTVPGLHSISELMFTEEYQAKFIEEYIKLIESKDFTIGEHVWNFADFRTAQHFRRVVMNLKGVFTRNREPKLAAFRIKELWSKK